jgi:hypothetical protein
MYCGLHDNQPRNEVWKSSKSLSRESSEVRRSSFIYFIFMVFVDVLKCMCICVLPPATGNRRQRTKRDDKAFFRPPPSPPLYPPPPSCNQNRTRGFHEYYHSFVIKNQHRIPIIINLLHGVGGRGYKTIFYTVSFFVSGEENPSSITHTAALRRVGECVSTNCTARSTYMLNPPGGVLLSAAS